MSKTQKWLVALAVLALLFWNPFTRSAILFLLPLGSGVDDLVFAALLIAVGTLYLYRRIKKTRDNRPDRPVVITYIKSKEDR